MNIRTELNYELELQNQRNEDAIVVKTIESDEIVGRRSMRGWAKKCPRMYMGAWRRNWNNLYLPDLRLQKEEAKY